MSDNNSPLCKIWASETALDGCDHYCHAEFAGLKGRAYQKDRIDEVLEKAFNLGGKWYLIACEPMKNDFQCEGCQYKGYKGLAYCYDSEELKKKELREVGYGR